MNLHPTLKSPSNLSRNYTEPEAAALIGVCRLTLLRLRQKGEIAFFRVGSRILYAPSHIEEFLSRCERRAERA